MRFIFYSFLILLAIIRVITNQPTYVDGDKIRISSRISGEPIKYENTQAVSLSGLTIYLEKFPEIHYGDHVVIEGEVDDKKLRNPVLKSHSEATGPLFLFRARMLSVYQRALPEPHSSLVSGVVLGSKQSIPPDFWEALKETGTAHVVVASGMNVTLVAGFLVSFFIIFLPRRRAISLALVGIWLYAIVSGFDAPIVRAAIMGSIGFTGLALGRVNSAWRGLFLSAILMIIVKPEWIGDLGFALSFVATGSLMLFQKPIETRIRFIPSVVREDFSTSLAAQIGVAPIIFVTFGQFNISSPLINALVLWTIAPITIIGMIGGFVGVIFFSLGKLILYTIFPLTSWFIAIVELFA